MTTVRVAIIGQGRSGRDIHGAHLSRDTGRYRIVAVVDPLADRRERAHAEYGCDVYADHRPLLRRNDIDLVVNAAPSKFHVPLTLRFLRAGFNVLCEKPLARRAADVDRLIDAAHKSGKVFAIFQQSRFAPGFVKMREVIASGILGDVVQVSFVNSGFQRRYDWQTLTSEMAGNLLNTGPHPLDQALQIFGSDAVPQVRCYMRNATSYGDADDHVELWLSGEGRPLVHLEISSCCPYPAPPYRVYATRGGLKGDANHLEWQYYLPSEAPELHLTREPLCKPDGTPAYCGDSLTWHKEEWSAPPDVGLFEGMSARYYAMLHRTLTCGAPLEITPEQVRQQIAVIQECQRQNRHIWR